MDEANVKLKVKTDNSGFDEGTKKAKEYKEAIEDAGGASGQLNVTARQTALTTDAIKVKATKIDIVGAGTITPNADVATSGGSPEGDKNSSAFKAKVKILLDGMAKAKDSLKWMESYSRVLADRAVSKFRKGMSAVAQYGRAMIDRSKAGFSKLGSALGNGLHDVAGMFGEIGNSLSSIFSKGNVYAALIAGAVMAMKKLVDETRKWHTMMVQGNVDNHIGAMERLNKVYEQQTWLLEKNRKVRNDRINNMRAEQDAANAYIAAAREAEKAQEMAGAYTDTEKADIEQKYAKKAMEEEFRVREQAVKRRAEDYDRDIGDKEKNIERMKELQKKRNAQIRAAAKMENDMISKESGGADMKTAARTMRSWFARTFGEDITAEQASDFRKTLGDAIKRARDEQEQLARKIAEEEAGVADTKGKKNSLWAERAKNEQDKAKAEAEQSLAKREEERRRAAEDLQREWDEEDRQRQEDEADYSSDNGRKDRYRNYQQKLQNRREMLATREAQMKEAEAAFADIRGRVSGRTMDQLTPEEKAELARRTSRLQEARQNYRSAKDEVAGMEYEGDQREAAFRGKFSQSNRLTQMALGGDATGYAKETSNNTKSLVLLCKGMAAELKLRNKGGTMAGFGGHFSVGSR